MTVAFGKMSILEKNITPGYVKLTKMNEENKSSLGPQRKYKICSRENFHRYQLLPNLFPLLQFCLLGRASGSRSFCNFNDSLPTPEANNLVQPCDPHIPQQRAHRHYIL